MGEDNDKNGDDSQEIAFSLHLTQSQVDMNSQMPMDIQEVCYYYYYYYCTWQHNEHKVPQNTQSAYTCETLRKKQAFSSLTPCLKLNVLILRTSVPP